MGLKIVYVFSIASKAPEKKYEDKSVNNKLQLLPDSSVPNSEVRLYKASIEKGNADQQRSILPISVNAQCHNKDAGKLLGSH